MKVNATDDVVLLIPTVAAYADVLDVTTRALARMWPDCPYRRVIATTGDGVVPAGFDVVRAAVDGGWCANLRDALTRIDARYVLLWIDDLVLVDRVATDAVHAAIAWALAEQVDYLRLNPSPRGWGEPVADRAIRHVPPGALYRTSTVCALWRRESIVRLLDPRETAWQLELAGSARSDALPAFYASERQLLPVANLVLKGRVDPRAARRVLRATGLSIASPRMVLSRAQTWREHLMDLRSRMLKGMPGPWQRAIRDFFIANGAVRRG